MATAVATAERQQEERKGLIGTVLGLPLRIFGLLLASLIISFVLEYVGLAFFWTEEGWHHSQAMFNTELGWLSETFKQSLIVSDPGHAAKVILEQVYEWCFVKTGFIAFTQQAAMNAQGDGTLAWLSRVYLLIEDYVLATIYVTLIFIVRLMVLTLSMPLFVMAMTIGFTDGLMRRDLRRFGAGRESSFIYHRARKLVVPLLIAPWFVYLSLPVSVSPTFVLIPCAIMLGIAVMVTAATFKKYL